MYTANDANFEDRTGELSQTSAKVLSYTSALSGTGWIPFCYVDGDYIDQTDVTHDQTAKTLTFTNKSKRENSSNPSRRRYSSPTHNTLWLKLRNHLSNPITLIFISHHRWLLFYSQA